jgi:hypothetical protein
LDKAERMPALRKTEYWPANLPLMVRTAIACDDLDLGERLALGLEPVYPYRAHALVAAEAILAEARDKPKEGASLYAESARRWERFGVVPERAHALLGQGRCLIDLGRPSEAISPLREARKIWVSLGATPALNETDVLLERATALSS